MPVSPPQDGREYQPAEFKRISWAAIFAGIIVVLVIQLTLSLFGLGIGASTIDPVEGETPTASSMSIGAAIWWVVVSIIALFTGGWVAARLAGMPNQTDGLLHGFITWGAATLVAVYFLTSTAGSILGGTFGILGDALSATGQGMAAFAPNVSDFALKQLSGTDMTWEDIKKEAQLLLQQTGKKDLQPTAVHVSGTNPQKSDEALISVLGRIIGEGKDVVLEVDKEALTNILVARTDMDRPEAQKTVQRWINTYQTATTKINQLQGQAQQQAVEAANATAKAVSQASIWTFISLIFWSLRRSIWKVCWCPTGPCDPDVTCCC